MKRQSGLEVDIFSTKIDVKVVQLRENLKRTKRAVPRRIKREKE